MWGATGGGERWQVISKFQLTLPVWGATLRVPSIVHAEVFQLTLPVWGATRFGRGNTTAERFQLTLPVWGATCRFSHHPMWTIFQLTLPVWGATRMGVCSFGTRMISTHAPRVGSDYLACYMWCRIAYFNSRSPCGERHSTTTPSGFTMPFQLTLPVWGATRSRPTHACAG